MTNYTYTEDAWHTYETQDELQEPDCIQEPLILTEPPQEEVWTGDEWIMPF